MGKDGEHSEFNMSDQTTQLQRQGWGNESGARGLNQNNNSDSSQKDYNKLLQSKVRLIVKLQAAWRGHTARRLISLLRAKQMGSSKYFTQEEARETVTKNRYNPN